MKIQKIILLLVLLAGTVLVTAQNPQATNRYDHLDYYVPVFDPPAGNVYRSANGTPGPMYWQNSADYLIHATLSEQDTTVAGDVTITYTNNSPDKLDWLWLQLDQNLFKESSRGSVATPYPAKTGTANGGFHIGNVTVNYLGETYAVTPVISDTRMQLRLKKPLFPEGGALTIKMDFSFVIPVEGVERMGILQTENGPLYEVAQLYPRMCVYDDIEGWNTLPYMGRGEFYCEYGNYDYRITAPASLIIYGSGDLQNPEEVLTPEEISRLSEAAKSDKTVAIIRPNEVGKAEMRPAGAETLTWHFKMENTRDVAWAASKALVWDAARVKVPSGRDVLAMSAYPVESVGDRAWSRATEYLKASMEIYSQAYFEYPWNTAVNIGGSVAGMEYPGMIFCDYQEVEGPLWLLIAHEIGHDWYPMIVGSNERRYMWQDEGLNTFINYRATEVFNGGEYFGDDSLYYKDYWSMFNVDKMPLRKNPLMILPDAISDDEGFEFYGKTSYGLKLLRDVVIGPDRFDYAFRKYTEAWAFKHPTPYDFFHCMNNATGEDLNWFWKSWFFTTGTLDQAVTGVSYVDKDPSKGALITLENLGKLIMPVPLKVVLTNGKENEMQLPVEIWQRGATWTFRYPSTGKIKEVLLDPQHVLPDIDRGNNLWEE